MPENDASGGYAESPDSELLRLRAQNAGQAALIEQLRQRIEELEARLAKDGHNSSKPPSSDPPFKKPPPRSQRKPSGRKRGGQKGHRGATRPLLEEPEHRVIIPLTGTCACGRVQRSAFSEGIAAPVQYGPGMSAFAVYMTQYQLLPYQRTADVLTELAGIAISAGSIHRAVTVAAGRLEEPVRAIGNALVQAPVAHADETGIRVGATLHWLHVLGTAQLTAYFPFPKRGAEAHNPSRPRKPGTRGRLKQSPAHNLIARLRKHRNEVLRFITDLRVPFDNNLPQRDIRMPKLKQKVSGCFRAESGAKHFATIRSYLSTLRKQSAVIYQSLILTLQGRPPMPRLG